ncbi:MAG: hypothetical protein LBQ24_02050 [Candidatus Peribacteria bacterium]|nr:hypothetical protein [Candidatus Peribacteria bacterium]
MCFLIIFSFISQYFSAIFPTSSKTKFSFLSSVNHSFTKSKSKSVENLSNP